VNQSSPCRLTERVKLLIGDLRMTGDVHYGMRKEIVNLNASGKPWLSGWEREGRRE